MRRFSWRRWIIITLAWGLFSTKIHVHFHATITTDIHLKTTLQDPAGNQRWKEQRERLVVSKMRGEKVKPLPNGAKPVRPRTHTHWTQACK
jgi:hypothetical protein